MSVLVLALSFIGLIAFNVLVNVVSEDLIAWTRYWSEFLVTRAANTLPPPLRKRFREEWLSELDRAPGSVWKLKFAIDISVRGARGVAGKSRLTNYRDLKRRLMSAWSIDRARSLARAVLLVASLILLTDAIIGFVEGGSKFRPVAMGLIGVFYFVIFVFVRLRHAQLNRRAI